MIEMNPMLKQLFWVVLTAFLLGCGSTSTSGENDESAQESSGEESTEGEEGEEGESTCVPECGDNICGDDGCGGICGACELGFA